jgi:uncharacterized membrane protein
VSAAGGQLSLRTGRPSGRARLRALRAGGWAAVVLLALIAIVAAITRFALLVSTSPAGSTTDPFGATYAKHGPTMLFHVVFGLAFMLLGPLQFVRRLRSAHPQVHRWCGRIYIVAGFVLGISALSIVLRFPIGGVNESTAITFAAAIFLFSLARAFVYIKRRDVVHHREWMIRAFALGLAISLDRIVLVLFLVFTGRPFSELFGVALWVSFSFMAVAGEIWINWTRPPRAVPAPVGSAG